MKKQQKTFTMIRCQENKFINKEFGRLANSFNGHTHTHTYPIFAMNLMKLDHKLKHFCCIQSKSIKFDCSN